VRSRAKSESYKENRRTGPLSAIRIHTAAGDRRRGWLDIAGQLIPVALGRGGVLANKREGDGGTPRGTFRPRRLWWRADRHIRPKTFLPIHNIKAGDAWCEDPADRHYNRPIRRQVDQKVGQNSDQPGDLLTRDDHLYDFIVEIDHNTRPRIAGRGSAVFLHLARPHFGPTAGCVAMTRPAMLRLLQRLGPRTKIIIE
jgi:L,D-peptidoglycan transpeptidase YkuD (ErfK/YbiS/YcfS/YnhG family)